LAGILSFTAPDGDHGRRRRRTMDHGWENRMARQTGTATFENEEWKEGPYLEGPGAIQLVQADMTLTYAGEITGQGIARFLMTYAGASETLFSGQERITGAVGGHEGSFVVRWVGTDDGGTTRASGTVIPGTGTGALAGLSGDLTLEAQRGGPSALTVEWEIA
jgi:hypothetical protein